MTSGSSLTAFLLEIFQQKNIKEAQIMSSRQSTTPHRLGMWKVFGSILVQLTLVTALLDTVLGDCGLPPKLQFASPLSQLYEPNFKAGTVLKYACHSGYRKVNSSRVTCGAYGAWIYNIFCIKKQCRNPGELTNGKVDVMTDFLFGSTIQFSCSKGYVLIGSTNSQCEVQGSEVEWSDPLPECVIVKCESPPEISNGKHGGGDEDLYTFGSSVTYSCDPNFSLIGNATIYCMVENKTLGVWRPNPPVCKKIFCHQPQIPKGIFISGFKPFYTHKDSIVVSCKKGYVLRGSNLIHCEAHNEWYPSVPTCELNGCSDLPEIPGAFLEKHIFAQKTQELFEIGTKLKYQCKPGHHAADELTVTCQQNLIWSTSKGCEKVCCPTPNLEKIKIVREKRDFTTVCAYISGDFIFYMCEEGYYTASSEGKSTCQEDGTWKPQIPECKPGCNFPPSIAHGRHKRVTSYNFFKYKIAYECDKGYQLVGPAKLSCSSSQWSPEPPQCKALCLKPEIENGKLSVDKNQFLEKESVTIQCDSGFRVVGSPRITCSQNRTWHPEVPECEWEVPEGCEQVLSGRKLMQRLPSPEDVKVALEMYKLSLETELLELQRYKARQSVLETPL
uniref:zona pellucida sperm-binding protein 3 receptor-like n=1 Tax=Urocitellus parryii TaxID=9999 RepID=UPI000E559A86|nr:zona pellucida sperm-binding protein 3 receptor-like [Urocitellus parryii]